MDQKLSYRRPPTAADRIFCPYGGGLVKSKSWFSRLLSAYLPIFYLVIVFLGFVFFMTIGQMANSQMAQSSETYAKHVMQTIESTLENINLIVIREINANEDIERFLYPDSLPGTNEHLLYSRVSEKLRSLQLNFPMIDSIYYYRIADRKVLSTSALLPNEYFGDDIFVRQLTEGDIPYTWTGVRDYRLFAENRISVPVVSLVKRVPLLSTVDGFLVVNVSTEALRAMVSKMTTQDISYLTVRDGEDQVILTTGESGGDELSVIRSDYAGWEIRSGLRSAYPYGFINEFYYGWIVVGLFAVLLGTIVIVLFARKYTSPIDGILLRITQYSRAKSQELPELVGDNPRFIESMVDHLIEAANHYSDAHKENLLYRRRQLFAEWVGGERAMDRQTWEREMTELRLETAFRRRYAALLEIHQYAGICEKYNSRDQYLFRFVIESVVQEIGAEAGVDVWSEWLEPERLTVLLQCGEEGDDSDSGIVSLCERIRQWIDENLDYTVSVGIGRGAADWDGVPVSFDEAGKALREKPVDGNATIAYSEVLQRGRGGAVDYLKSVHLIVDGFKRRDRAWEAELVRFLEEVAQRLTVRQDVDHIMTYFLFNLSNAFSELPAASKEIWDAAESQMKNALQQYASVEEIGALFLRHMRAAAEQIEKLRAVRSNQEAIRRVKAYIEEHANVPELSLGLLSEQFQMNQSYMSRMFKEAFGENFVDYLAKIRIARSIELLRSTDAPIHKVALEVGYLYTFSFNRVFKKIVGVTPGEYRKQSQSCGTAAAGLSYDPGERGER